MAVPSRGSDSMIGFQRDRLLAISTLVHWMRCADRPSRAIWRFSAANDFTTRVPLTFSSTMVAKSAMRAWVTHDNGNT